MSIITASLGGSTAHPLELSLEKCSTADTEIEELACEYEAFREGLTLNSESPSHQDWVESVVKVSEQVIHGVYLGRLTISAVVKESPRGYEQHG